MRIGIDARPASHSQRGGFKTYTENLIQGLARIDSRNEYFLYVDRPVGANFLRVGSNFSLRVVPAGPKLIGAGFREQVMLPRCLARDKVDMAHFLCNTSPVRYPGNLVVTIHDTIPLIYFSVLPAGPSPRMLKQFAIQLHQRLFLPQAACKATAIITDSEHSKRDIISRLNVDPVKIFVVYLAQNDVFRLLSLDAKARARAEIAKEFGINPTQRYILGIGSADPRKNIEALVSAYSELDEKLQDAYHLVMVLAHGALRERLSRTVAAQGLDTKAVFIDSQPHDRLLLLYNLAELFVFPSLYEGFGMPVVEAMACGSPVVASNTSSLPEIAGDAALLVDPNNTAALSEAMSAVLTNHDLRSSLRQKGVRRAKLFSWEKTARETVAVYQQAYQAYGGNHQ